MDDTEVGLTDSLPALLAKKPYRQTGPSSIWIPCLVFTVPWEHPISDVVEPCAEDENHNVRLWLNGNRS